MQAGAVLGAYRVIKRIGAGGMGSVWMAEHTILGRKAALKVLHPAMSKRQDVVRRFFNEARAATAIPDPGIVQIFDFGYHDDGSAYIVMELLDGEVLEQRLARGPLDVAQALRIMRQVASTLAAAHSRGIIHRDLKPDNIFIARDPEVAGGERAKILDFGIAKLEDERKTAMIHLDGEPQAPATSTGIIGTPLYMSPEQRAGTHVDARSDVYALGCVLYQVLTGRPPYDPEDLHALIAMHISAPIPLPSASVPGVPQIVDEVVQRCMAKQPADRYASGSELAAALADAAVRPSTSPILGITSTGDEALPETLRRRPASAPAIPAGDDEPTSAHPSYQVIAAAAAVNPAAKVTTLTGASGSTLSGRPKARPRVLVAAGLFAAAGAGLVVWSLARSTTSEPTATTANEASAAPESAPTPPEPPPPPPPEPAPDLGAQLTTRMMDVLARFRAWARTHPAAPCPQLAELGDVTTDPWGQPFVVTCTDQPDDQQIGLVSSGPDAVAGTDDDVRSWRLGNAVRELAHGTRWGEAPGDVTETTDDTQVADKTVTKPPRPGKRPIKKPVTKPTKPPKGTGIQLDANGIPVHR